MLPSTHTGTIVSLAISADRKRGQRKKVSALLQFPLHPSTTNKKAATGPLSSTERVASAVETRNVVVSLGTGNVSLAAELYLRRKKCHKTHEMIVRYT